MFKFSKFSELDFLKAKIAEIKQEIAEKKAAKAEQKLVLETRAQYDLLKAELASL